MDDVMQLFELHHLARGITVLGVSDIFAGERLYISYAITIV